MKNWAFNLFLASKKSQKSKITEQKQLKSFEKQSGNVFLMLFGAVAMVGVLGASTMTILKGPVKTMSQVTKRTVAENNMITTAKLAIIAANEPSDDCDTDSFIEPDEAGAAIAAFNGGTDGGEIPGTIGVTKTDPWGNLYGYCVWDHGIVDDAGCGGGTQNRLAGDNVNAVVSDYVVAVISAGADGSYDSTCNDFAGVGTTLTKSGDDIVFGYTYNDASAVVGGLWSEDGTTGATITRDISVRDSSDDIQFAIDSALKTLTVGDGTTGTGLFPTVNTDNLQSYGGAGGTINVDSILDSNSNITTTSNVSAQDLIAGGDATIGGNLEVTGGSILANVSANIIGATALSVTGLTTLDSATITNNAAVNGTFSTTGDTNLGNDAGDTTTVTGTLALDSLNVTNNATIGGTLDVTAATTLDSLTAGTTTTGALTANGNVIVNGNFLDMTGERIRNLGTPGVDTDAATKKYVDDNIAAGTGYTESDPTITNKVANRFCQVDGTASDLLCNVDLATIETDPTIGTPLTSGRLCTYNGSNIVCNTDTASVGGGGSLFTDNTTHISRGNFHILNAGLAAGTNTAGLNGAVALQTGAFYDQDKGAMRGGANFATNSWQDANIGDYSFGWGLNAEASGHSSVALGGDITGDVQGPVASGDGSVAIGSGFNAAGGPPTAEGNFSTAIGIGAYAIGESGTAIGPFTQALGGNSTALGSYLTSSGFGSTAFGYGANAGTGTAQTTDTNSGQGNYSMAFGLGDSGFPSPQITGNESAAFFFGNQANENITATNVLALEGGSLLLSNDSGTACDAAKAGALRLNATSDGLEMCDGVSAWAAFSGGGGGSSLFTDNTTHITRENFSIINTGETSDTAGQNVAGFASFYDPNKAAFRGGRLLTVSKWQDSNIGGSSFAWGVNAQANGSSSAVLGGNNNTASGGQSVAIGGQGNTASGTTSSAIGQNNTASGALSHTLGSDNTASGFGSISLGNTSTANGTYSSVKGRESIASGYGSYSFGQEVMAGDGTAQVADVATAGKGKYSFAFGLGNSSTATIPRVSGNESAAFFFGDQNSADITATNVLALEGGSLLLSNDSGTACAANKAGALRLNATADGLEMCDGVSAWAAFSGGGSSLWTDNTTHVSYENQHIIKSGQTSTTAGLDGDGTRSFYDPTKGAFRGGQITGGATAWQNTNIGTNSFAWGENNIASGASSVALGAGSRATGGLSFAFGFNSTISGANSLGFGPGAVVSGDNSYAMGFQTSISGENSFALGRNINVSANNSFGFSLGTHTLPRATVTGNETAVFFFGDQGSEDITATNVLALEGGSLLLSNDSGTACAANKAGALRLNATADGLEMCDGVSTWAAFGGGGTTAINDLTDGITDYVTDFNMFLGQGAGAAIASGGQNNTAIGLNAGGAITTGSVNVAIGTNAMASVTTGGGNTAVGYNSQTLSTGSANTSFGVNTLASNTTAGLNTAIGDTALGSNTTGSGNTALGFHAARDLNSGGANIAIGPRTMDDLETGSDNTIIGAYSSGSITTGSSNTFIGSRTANGKLSGNYNILIGRSANTTTTTASEELNIGGIIFGDIGTTSNDPKIGAHKYCDESLANCFVATDVSGGSSLWTTGADDDIFYNTGTNPEVGIGIAAPTKALHVYEVSDNTSAIFETGQGDSGIQIKSTAGDSLIQYDGGSDGLEFRIGGINPTAADMYLSNSGGLVIANNESFTGNPIEPSAQLEVRSTTKGILGPRLLTTEKTGIALPATGLFVFDTDLNRYQYNSGTTAAPVWSDMATGTGLFTDNTTHITRENFHILDAGLAAGSTTAGLDGDGVLMFFDPDKGALRGGQRDFLLFSGNDAWEDASIGNNSISWGANAVADGDYSSAFGRSSRASGSYSFATGLEANATGLVSFATGFQTFATGDNSLAFGSQTTASGYNGFSLGNNTRVGTGVAQTSDANSDVGNYSMAFGLGNASTATYPQVTGNESAAFFFGDQQGEDITATNVLALEGGSLLLSNDSGTACAANKAGALRLNATSDGLEMCDGTSTWVAFGGGGSLFTDNTTHITREGFNVINTASNSTAASLDGDGSRAFYASNKSALRGGTISGANDAWQDTNIGANSFAWGENASATNGNSFAFGLNATATGFQSLAFGESTISSSGHTFAMGYQAEALNDSNIAIGYQTKSTSAFGSTAIGFRSNASGRFSTAFGKDISAAGQSSFALGLGTSTAPYPTVSAVSSAGIFFGNQTGADITATNVLALEGGSLLLSNDSGTACAANKAGALRLNAAANGLEMCDGTSTWETYGGIWSPGTGDDVYYDATTPQVGIGTTSPSEALHVDGNVLADAYLHTSDENLKKDIKTANGLDLINALRGVTFTYKEDNRQSAGIIAQDVKKVLPRAVQENSGGFLTVDYNQLFAPIIESIKDLHKMIIDLGDKIKTIFDKITTLENENTALKSEIEILQKQNQDILKRLDAIESNKQAGKDNQSAKNTAYKAEF